VGIAPASGGAELAGEDACWEAGGAGPAGVDVGWVAVAGAVEAAGDALDVAGAEPAATDPVAGADEVGEELAGSGDAAAEVAAEAEAEADDVAGAVVTVAPCALGASLWSLAVCCVGPTPLASESVPGDPPFRPVK
jgi:hypothetical protein